MTVTRYSKALLLSFQDSSDIRTNRALISVGANIISHLRDFETIDALHPKLRTSIFGNSVANFRLAIRNPHELPWKCNKIICPRTQFLCRKVVSTSRTEGNVSNDSMAANVLSQHFKYFGASRAGCSRGWAGFGAPRFSIEGSFLSLPKTGRRSIKSRRGYLKTSSGFESLFDFSPCTHRLP
jgi:hypothetical protein